MSAGAPFREVSARHCSQDWIQFHANHLSKPIFRCKQNRPSHSSAEIKEGEALDRCGGPGPLPTLEQRLKHRGSYAEVGGGMAVVCVAGLKEPSGNEAAGLNAVFKIEGMLREALFG